MTKEQEKLCQEFCKFAKLQDNSDAELPNIQPSLQLYMAGTPIKGWDALDDCSLVTPEFLTYILLKAKEFYA